MAIKDTAPVHLWLCSSCAGWHYAYCDAALVRAKFSEATECIKEQRIVKCPLNKYHFICTRSYSTLARVLEDFPEALGKFHPFQGVSQQTLPNDDESSHSAPY